MTAYPRKSDYKIASQISAHKEVTDETDPMIKVRCI
jgi:hypothetical protein